MEFSRQEYRSGLPFPSPGDLPNPGTEPGSPAFQTDSLLSEQPGKPINVEGVTIQLPFCSELNTIPQKINPLGISERELL